MLKIRSFETPTDVIVLPLNYTHLGSTDDYTEDEIAAAKETEPYTLWLTDDECNMYVDGSYYETFGSITILTVEEYNKVANIHEISEYFPALLFKDYVGDFSVEMKNHDNTPIETPETLDNYLWDYLSAKEIDPNDVEINLVYNTDFESEEYFDEDLD